MKQSPLILISPLVIFDSRHLHATTYLKHFYCFYYSLHHTKLRFCYLSLWRILDNFFPLTNYLIQGIANKVSFLKSFWLFFQEFYAPMYQIVRLNCYDLSFLSFLPFIVFQKRNLCDVLCTNLFLLCNLLSVLPMLNINETVIILFHDLWKSTWSFRKN